MSIYNTSALLFAVFAVIHIVYNWRSIVHCAKMVRGLSISKEAIYAVIPVLVAVGLFSSHVFHIG
jgi:hypothetical protein